MTQGMVNTALENMINDRGPEFFERTAELLDQEKNPIDGLLRDLFKADDYRNTGKIESMDRGMIVAHLFYAHKNIKKALLNGGTDGIIYAAKEFIDQFDEVLNDTELPVKDQWIDDAEEDAALEGWGSE